MKKFGPNPFFGENFMGDMGRTFHSNSCIFCNGFLQGANLCAIADEGLRKLCLLCYSTIFFVHSGLPENVNM